MALTDCSAHCAGKAGSAVVYGPRPVQSPISAVADEGDDHLLRVGVRPARVARGSVLGVGAGYEEGPGDGGVEGGEFGVVRGGHQVGVGRL